MPTVALIDSVFVRTAPGSCVFPLCRGEGSFGVIAFGSCGYTNSDGTVPFPVDAVAASADADPDCEWCCALVRECILSLHSCGCSGQWPCAVALVVVVVVGSWEGGVYAASH